jgi:hypothetical protein
VAVAAALVVGLAGCGGGGGSGRAPATGPPTSATAATLDVPTMTAAVRGLCTARTQAETDVKSVRATFYDRSHEALHTIARVLEPVDRPLAARLLEAKAAVEADVNAQPLRPTVAADLDRLVDVTVQALARLSVTAPRCR